VAEVEILKKQEKSLISEDPRETEWQSFRTQVTFLLQGMHPKEVKAGTQADACMWTFTTALFKKSEWEKHK
jgi:hypothetical protein